MQNHPLYFCKKHSTVEIEKVWQKEYGSNIIFNHGSNMSSGTAIILPRNITFDILNIFRCENGRWNRN